MITLSRDAATAVAQGQAYLASLERGEILRPRADVLFLGTSAYVFIVMGLTAQLQTAVVSELIRSTSQSLLPPNFQIVPYDHLYRMFVASVPPRFLVVLPLAEAADSEESDPFEFGYMGPSHDDVDDDHQ